MEKNTYGLKKSDNDSVKNDNVENHNVDFTNDIGSEDFLTEHISKKEVTCNNNANIKDLIAVWAVEEHVPHISLSKLLKILKIHQCNKDFPSDTHTLL